MAVKYSRKVGGSNRQVYWHVPKIRPRLVYIYVGMSFIAALLVAYFALAGRAGTDAGALEARATVLEKSMEGRNDDGRRFRVVLEATLSNGETVETSLYTDESSWDALLPGDHVAVTFGRPLVSGGIHVQSMRLIDE